MKSPLFLSRFAVEGGVWNLFFVDFYGHVDDELTQNILSEIKNNTYFFKILGSYPEKAVISL